MPVFLSANCTLLNAPVFLSANCTERKTGDKLMRSYSEEGAVTTVTNQNCKVYPNVLSFNNSIFKAYVSYSG